ncbi:MAG: hypothetical protein IPK03_11295 [Bacteroidetes bacterium]|nr:hypothetical protein [Bacteroidota bacterium]
MAQKLRSTPLHLTNNSGSAGIMINQLHADAVYLNTTDNSVLAIAKGN